MRKTIMKSLSKKQKNKYQVDNAIILAAGTASRFAPLSYEKHKSLIEVKGDNKIDDVVVKAKQAAAEEMAVASGMEYIMYAGSKIMNSHVLE